MSSTSVIFLVGDTEMIDSYVEKFSGYKNFVFLDCCPVLCINDVLEPVSKNKKVMIRADRYKNKKAVKRQMNFVRDYFRDAITVNCILFGDFKKSKYIPNLKEGYTNIKIIKSF